MDVLKGWVDGAPILILGVAVLVLMLLAALTGATIRRRHERDRQGEALGEGEGYIVSGVLGLLALLLGFTFALAVDRFETRRALVLQEANAIGTTYLRTQLLEEPHRARISGLLVDYADNRLALAKAEFPEGRDLLARNDRLVTELWAATSSAFLTIKGLDFSSTYLDSMNNLIDLDAARKAARQVRVPTEVFVILVVYLVVTAGVLGYVFDGSRGRAAAVFMLLLLSMSLMLIIDIDRPRRGGIQEGQGPMEALLKSLKSEPPSVYDRYRIEDARPIAAPAN
ncbi:hypothetical protein [Phenylobacterium sp.]|uniref:bestrophin-like domain n=1 Tax=Phenylobacterium sp. TaxID=1871053 RepID=UPI0028A074DB|nr:hypothetical protein [Phenylobacterium sp.]